MLHAGNCDKAGLLKQLPRRIDLLEAKRKTAAGSAVFRHVARPVQLITSRPVAVANHVG